MLDFPMSEGNPKLDFAAAGFEISSAKNGSLTGQKRVILMISIFDAIVKYPPSCSQNLIKVGFTYPLAIQIFTLYLENQPPSQSGFALTPCSALSQPSARLSFVDNGFGKLVQEEIPDLLADAGIRKPKRIKIPLDRRIELTDDELKV